MPSAAQQMFAKGFTFSNYMITAITASYLPLYFDSAGFSKIQIGMLYAIGPMIGIFSNLLWGYFSDKWNATRKVLLILFTGQLLMAPIVFHVYSFWLLYACMAMFFFFQQPVSTVNDSQLLLISSQTGKSYASFRVFGSIGFAAASLSFGLILKQTGPGWTQYLAYTVISICFMICLLMKDARTGGPSGRSYKPVQFRSMAAIVSSRKFTRFLLLLLVMSVAHRMNDGFLALFLRQLHASESVVGYAWTASSLSEIPVFFLLSKFGHKFKELPLLTLACTVYVIRFLLLSCVTDPVWGVALQLLHSLSFGIFLFTAIRYIQGIIPDEFRASGQAIFAVTWQSTAGLLSGLIGGWVFDVWGGRSLYRVAAGLAFLAAVGFALTHFFAERQQQKTARILHNSKLNQKF